MLKPEIIDFIKRKKEKELKENTEERPRVYVPTPEELEEYQDEEKEKKEWKIDLKTRSW